MGIIDELTVVEGEASTEETPAVGDAEGEPEVDGSEADDSDADDSDAEVEAALEDEVAEEGEEPSSPETVEDSAATSEEEAVLAEPEDEADKSDG